MYSDIEAVPDAWYYHIGYTPSASGMLHYLQFQGGDIKDAWSDSKSDVLIKLIQAMTKKHIGADAADKDILKTIWDIVSQSKNTWNDELWHNLLVEVYEAPIKHDFANLILKEIPEKYFLNLSESTKGKFVVRALCKDDLPQLSRLVKNDKNILHKTASNNLLLLSHSTLCVKFLLESGVHIPEGTRTAIRKRHSQKRIGLLKLIEQHEIKHQSMSEQEETKTRWVFEDLGKEADTYSIRHALESAATLPNIQKHGLSPVQWLALNYPFHLTSENISDFRTTESLLQENSFGVNAMQYALISGMPIGLFNTLLEQCGGATAIPYIFKKYGYESLVDEVCRLEECNVDMYHGDTLKFYCMSGGASLKDYKNSIGQSEKQSLGEYDHTRLIDWPRQELLCKMAEKCPSYAIHIMNGFHEFDIYEANAVGGVANEWQSLVYTVMKCMEGNSGFPLERVTRAIEKSPQLFEDLKSKVLGDNGKAWKQIIGFQNDTYEPMAQQNARWAQMVSAGEAAMLKSSFSNTNERVAKYAL